MNLGMPEMIFIFGTPDMIFIFLLALIIFGPKKLPEIGRQLARAMTEFKRASNEFKSQLEAEIRDLEIDQNSIAPPSTPPQGVIVRDNSYHDGPTPELPEASSSAEASGNGHAVNLDAHSATPDAHSIPPAQGYDA
jgi:TatA/E family protein of Tat protein translocase